MDDDLAETVVAAVRTRDRRAEPVGAVDEDTLVRARTAGDKDTSDSPPRVVHHAAPGDTIGSPPLHADGRYRFRVNGGEPIPTDTVTLIGRAPRAPRVPRASDLRLIAVPSPAHEVSGTHVELRQQGAAVVVTDLRSTNGTVISVPGAARIALRPGESFVAGPGSVIDIGDGNAIEVLSIDRLVPHGPASRAVP